MSPGTVFVEKVKQNGQWKYSCLSVDVPGHGQKSRRIILIDNRMPNNQKLLPSKKKFGFGLLTGERNVKETS